jgi:hypothetical protein
MKTSGSGASGWESPLKVDARDGRSVYFIAADLSLEAVPVVAFFGPIWVYFMELVIFMMQGRWAYCLPTISETGVGEFSNRVQSRAFVLIGVCYLTSNFLIAMCRSGPGPQSVVLWASVVFAIIGVTGSVACGSLSLEFHSTAHFVVGFFGLGSLNVLMLLNSVLGASWTSRAQLTARILVMMTSSCGLFAAGCSETFVPSRKSITVSTLGEYVLVAATQTYIASFYKDLRKCRLTMFYVADLRNCRTAHATCVVDCIHGGQLLNDPTAEPSGKTES